MGLMRAFFVLSRTAAARFSGSYVHAAACETVRPAMYMRMTTSPQSSRHKGEFRQVLNGAVTCAVVPLYFETRIGEVPLDRLVPPAFAELSMAPHPSPGFCLTQTSDVVRPSPPCHGDRSVPCWDLADVPVLVCPMTRTARVRNGGSPPPFAAPISPAGGSGLQRAKPSDLCGRPASGSGRPRHTGEHDRLKDAKLLRSATGNTCG